MSTFTISDLIDKAVNSLSSNQSYRLRKLAGPIFHDADFAPRAMNFLSRGLRAALTAGRVASYSG
jgi:hypothetical protein